MAAVNKESTPIKQLLNHYMTLPRLYQTKDDSQVKLDWFKDEDLPGIFELANKVVEDGTAGFAETEFDTMEKLKWHIDNAFTAVSGVEVATGKLVCFMFAYPSPLTRSVSPVMHAAHVITDSKYQNLGLGTEVMTVGSAAILEAGYIGGLSRGLLPHVPAILLSLSLGCKVAGWIPRSLYARKYGMSDDLIVDRDYTQMFPLQQPRLPDILERINKGQLMRPNKKFEKMFTGITMKEVLQAEKGTTLIVRHAEKDELQEIFAILTQAANSGDSFALDEFPNYDIFTDRFLHGRTVFVVENLGKIVGTFVMGPNYLCRGNNPDIAVLYVYILPEHRNKGIGSVATEAAIDLAKKQKFRGIFADIFITKNLPYRYMRKFGFLWIGTLRNSGFVKGEGLTDCALFYKDFSGFLHGRINMSNL